MKPFFQVYCSVYASELSQNLFSFSILHYVRFRIARKVCGNVSSVLAERILLACSNIQSHSSVSSVLLIFVPASCGFGDTDHVTPWMAGLSMIRGDGNLYQFCTATIISDTTVVTAAQCWYV